MAYDITQRVDKYFQQRLISHPQIVERGELHGWFEGGRAELSRIFLNSPVKEFTGEIYSNLSSVIYSIQRGVTSAVFALYQDNTLLWLDDHTNNDDFDTFIKRENLVTWLPKELGNLVSLVANTKFNYLGQPFVIHNISEIPAIPDEVKAEMKEYSSSLKELQHNEQHLAEIADKIYFPQLIKHHAAKEIKFCVWTRLVGRVVDISCFFQEDGGFKYQGIDLASCVGRYIVPR